MTGFARLEACATFGRLRVSFPMGINATCRL